ncbi:MAG: MFS transporter, partial [Deltaproteobacteria bacterium]|nr:MFS transporter [Deltaproteobacteria bacterium]
MEPPSSRPSRRVAAPGLGAWAATQALAAFSDNYLRSALGWWVFAASVRSDAWPLALAGGVLAFALPSVLLSGQAGTWADLGDRRRVLLAAQVVGLGAGLVGAGALWAHSWPALAAAVVLCGVRAALLGPVKYALLPDLLPEERWLAGNAAVEAGTYVAALIGTATGVLAVLPGWEVAALVLAIWPAVGGAMSAVRFGR